MGAQEYIDGEYFAALPQVLRGSFEVGLYEEAPQELRDRVLVGANFLLKDWADRFGALDDLRAQSVGRANGSEC